MQETWAYSDFIEIFGAAAGILYVFLEVRQNRWLWFVGILTSAVYIYVFFRSKLYADMSLQGYYLVISFIGWYWWSHGRSGQTEGQGAGEIQVTHIKRKTALIILFLFALLFTALAFILSEYTDSPVPVWDSFITSLSVVATWMLARKIYEHWYLWIVVNAVSAVLFTARGLYPTVILYIVYCVMSFAGLYQWRKTIGRPA